MPDRDFSGLMPAGWRLDFGISVSFWGQLFSFSTEAAWLDGQTDRHTACWLRHHLPLDSAGSMLEIQYYHSASLLPIFRQQEQGGMVQIEDIV